MNRSSPIQVVNSLTDNNVGQEIIKLLRSLKRDINLNKPHSYVPSTNMNQNNNANASQPDSTNTKPIKKIGKRKRRWDTSKYCWSCGAFNHHSKDCKFKKEGHQDSATFRDRMGGSTEFCQVCD